VISLAGKDVFVHISAVEKAGFNGLAEGAKVSYEIVANRGKESAENLRGRDAWIFRWSWRGADHATSPRRSHSSFRSCSAFEALQYFHRTAVTASSSSLVMARSGKCSQ